LPALTLVTHLTDSTERKIRTTLDHGTRAKVGCSALNIAAKGGSLRRYAPRWAALDFLLVFFSMSAIIVLVVSLVNH